MANKSLTTPILTLMGICAVVNLRNLPFMASLGQKAIFFYLLAAVCFLVPSSLVCARLACRYNQAGGLYLWVSKAFGKRIGFFAIWAEWFNNVIGFPATLAFISASFLFVFFPHIRLHRNWLLCVILLLLVSTTLYNFLGVKASGRLSALGALLGTIVPALLIIIFALMSHKVHFHSLSWHHVASVHGHWSSLSMLVGVMLSYSGMQAISFHAADVKNPSKTFKRATWAAAFSIFLITVVPTLVISQVVTHAKLSFVNGTIQGVSVLLKQLHMSDALGVVILLICFGGLASLSTWLLAPARGLQVAAKEGFLPAFFAKKNANDMPVNILILQMIITAILAVMLTKSTSLNSGFWLLSVMTGQFSLLMYVFVFAASLKLLWRELSIPFIILIVIALILCVVAIMLGFEPPPSLRPDGLVHYDDRLFVTMLLYISVPMCCLFRLKKAKA